VIVHTVRFGFKADVTEEQQANALETLAAMAALEPVAFSTLGRSLSGRGSGLTHAYCIAFADLAALRDYLRDPVLHEGDRKIVPLFARLSVEPDITDDPDPDLGAKITAAFEETVAAHPDWGRVLQSVPQFTIDNA
jgi:hypothetical protein